MLQPFVFIKALLPLGALMVITCNPGMHVDHLAKAR